MVFLVEELDMFDDLIAIFCESFELFDISYDKGMEEVGLHFRAAVELVGLDDTIKAIRDRINLTEGWTVEDLRVINELAGREVFNV